MSHLYVTPAELDTALLQETAPPVTSLSIIVLIAIQLPNVMPVKQGFWFQTKAINVLPVVS